MSSGPAFDSPVEPSVERPLEDRLVDGVFDESFDWVEVVRSYPLPCVAVAAVAGFLVGRAHGPQLFDAASDVVTDRVVRSLGGLDTL